MGVGTPPAAASDLKTAKGPAVRAPAATFTAVLAALVVAVPAGATAGGPPAPQIQITATSVASGRAVLAVPADCQSGRYPVTVSGRAMRSVAFHLDGRRVRTVRVRGDATSVTVRLGSRARVHRVRAHVTFLASARTRARDLRATVRRCGPALAG
jgi:hypothetical protein